MKITRVHSWLEEIELTRPYSIAFASFDHIRMFFVAIELEDGTLGSGSGNPVASITGERLDDSLALLESKLDGLVGEDLRHAVPLLRQLADTYHAAPAARAAVDMALHDLMAQKLGLPLADVLGRAHDRLPTSITLGIRSPEETVDEAREYVGRGFRILKLKTGVNVDQDLEVLARLHEAVGPEILIRVDANQAYSASDLRDFHDRAARFRLELIEQPLPGGDAEAMRDLPTELRRACAADESLHSPAHALGLASRPRPFGIYNIKLMKCGGIAPARDIARIAELGEIHLMWGCMDESVISITAALHAALASPATRYLDLDGSLDLARDPAEGGFVLEDGYLRTSDRPGLGILSLDEP